jgi:hypothetical protein
MEKLCACGKHVSIQLCTVIFQNKINIENVPVFSCGFCGRNEVYPAVKGDLKELIAQCEIDSEEKVFVSFHEVSEVSHFCMQMMQQGDTSKSMRQLIDDRINELLDTFILARSLSDLKWTDDIHRRLLQLNALKSESDAAVS